MIAPDQLTIGTEHELEHTTDWRIAQQIAMDHLREDPDYYRKLARCGLGGTMGSIDVPTDEAVDYYLRAAIWTMSDDDRRAYGDDFAPSHFTAETGVSVSILMYAPRARPFHEFAPGNASFEIEDLQGQLNMLGYGLQVNGLWDSPTQQAVLVFKVSHGLPPTVLVDSDVADAIYADLEKIDPVTGQPKKNAVQMDPINITGNRPGWGWLLLALGAGVALFW